MTSQKKNKGRPKGSEIDDSAALSAIADMMHIAPELKASTAMRRYKRHASEAEVRRWQAKWKERKEALMAAAAERSNHRDRQIAARPPELRGAMIIAALGSLPDNAVMRMARGIDISPAMKAITAYQNSPAMKMALALENSPTMRLARQMQDSPIARMARAMQDSPIAQMAKAHQQVAERLGKIGGTWG